MNRYKIKDTPFRVKVALVVASAFLSVVLSFFFTMLVFPDAPDKNKVFYAVAAIVFLVIECVKETA